MVAGAGRVVWENRFGGLTWEVGAGPARRFVKWSPAGKGPDLRIEAAKLAWARQHTPVPELISQGADDTGTWLVTGPLPGSSAVTERWHAQPRTAVRAIGEGLRALHEALPVASCPFSYSIADRLAAMRADLDGGRIEGQWWPAPGPPLPVARALELLADPPPDDVVVVCHGDTCAPNTLLTDNGRWSGHVDLGELGVADRWADLSVATWSVTCNYGTGWEDELLAAYGTGLDHDRSDYYRLLGRCS